MPRRRHWLEPVLWLGIPSLLVVAPWAARQWAQLRPAQGATERVSIRLTGDPRQDRLMLLERAWTAARPRPLPASLPLTTVDRITRREAAWLAEIVLQLRPLDPPKAALVLEEAIQRIEDLPERMGPEELVAPGGTPTAALLRLARAFRTDAAAARRARRAALERARTADWPRSQVYALCLVARETATADPALAGEALRDARRVSESLSARERPGALAALASSTALVQSPEAAQPLVGRVLRGIESGVPGPVATAVAASLIAPAAPEAADRLAARAVQRAAASRTPEDLPFRDAVEEPVVEEPFGLTAGARMPAPGYPSRRADRARDVTDAQLRRVAAALAVTHPELAVRAARQIRRPEDRSGSLTEVGAMLERRDPDRAVELYRGALAAADKIRRPIAARRAARLRAAMGLAAFDPAAAMTVVEPLPPRLMLLQLNELATRLARRDPAAALRVIEKGERSIGANPSTGPFLIARAAVAAQVARDDPRRAANLLGAAPLRRAVDGWLILARGLAEGEETATGGRDAR
jgi:hypothetical protein